MTRVGLSAVVAAALVASGAGCVKVEQPARQGLASFDVKVVGVYAPGTTTTVDVVTACAKKYGGQAAVPADQRGTRPCPYAMPRGEVDVQLSATALDVNASPLTDFFGPVSFRAVPGDLTGGYLQRWAQAHQGKAELAQLKVAHLYGPVRFWAEDAPPQPIFDGGAQIIDTQQLPVEPDPRSYASGLSPTLYFEDPTLARVQIPDGWDNRSSPLVGQFLTIGKDPQSGETLTQSCADDPDLDGQPAAMVVTGLDPSGYFITDVTACRLKEVTKDAAGTTQVSVPEPDGFLPGTFGALFVYNYSFPDGLNQGDLLFTVSGSVQEFTSTTQLTFPAWSIAEKVREKSPDQWDKWLKYARPYDISLRTCGLDDVRAPFVTDVTCGQNKRNLKLESLESALVRVRGVRFPQAFTNCDFNADTAVPFFCESKLIADGCPAACDDPTPYCSPALKQCVPDAWGWRDCNFGGETEPANETAERVCLIKCVTQQGEWQGTRCSEKSTFVNYGQFVVEMAGPGPAEAGLDPSLASRAQEVQLTAASARTGSAYRSGDQVRVWCNAAARMKFGDSSVAASTADVPFAAGATAEHTFAGNETHVAFVADGAVSAGSKCVVAQNTHTLINLTTRDAVPDLQPDCGDADPDPAKAEQCRWLHAATFDVVGHLRQVQPARPRWMVMPRDADDLCCHPGPGLSCPYPIKPCP